MATTKRSPGSGSRSDPARERRRVLLMTWLVLPLVLLVTLLLVYRALTFE